MCAVVFRFFPTVSQLLFCKASRTRRMFQSSLHWYMSEKIIYSYILHNSSKLQQVAFFCC
jgi:hypothetical protein